jgi:hypothetical protein
MLRRFDHGITRNPLLAASCATATHRAAPAARPAACSSPRYCIWRRKHSARRLSMRPDASNVEERLTAGGRELAVLTASAMQAARPPPPIHCRTALMPHALMRRTS